MSPVRIPAVVPAAGKSRRMGQPKLLLPFDGQPLIGRLVAALRQGGAEPVIVVAPPPDSPEGPAVAEAAAKAGGVVIAPSRRPAEMRESVELALEALGARRRGPARGIPPDAWRQPGTDAGDRPPDRGSVVRSIPARSSSPAPPAGTAIRSSSPGTSPARSLRCPAHEGINALVARHPDRIVEIELPHPELAADLNTPQDLERWHQREHSLVKIRLFAVARERAGQSEIAIELPLPATVADLRLALALQHPELSPLASRVMVAVNSEYASDNTMILPGAAVALIPPVSGG